MCSISIIDSLGFSVRFSRRFPFIEEEAVTRLDGGLPDSSAHLRLYGRRLRVTCRVLTWKVRSNSNGLVRRKVHRPCSALYRQESESPIRTVILFSYQHSLDQWIPCVRTYYKKKQVGASGRQ